MDKVIYNKKVLFLDDEGNILKSLGRTVGRMGFEVQFTTDPDEALRWVEAGEFAIVVSDHRMPKITGTEFLGKVRELSPKSIRILLTGYADIGAAIQAVNHSRVYKYLTKPWDEQQLQEVLTEACEQFNLIAKNIQLEKELKELNSSLEKRVEERTQEVSMLNQELSKGFLGSIKLMGQIAHQDKPELAAHSKRVAVLSVKVAKALGLSSREQFEIQIASFLHDIGRKQIHELNDDHAKRGFELMKLIPNLGDAYEIVREHHRSEKTDKKNKAKKTLIGTKILKAVDVFDERSNLSDEAVAATPKKVLQYMKEQGVDAFDAGVLTALVNCLQDEQALEDSQYETVVTLYALTPGMVLARDLRTQRGHVIAAKDFKIDKDYLSRIIRRNAEDPIEEDIYVYKNSVESLKKGA